MLVSIDVVECIIYVDRPIGGTLALKINLYLVVEACGANEFKSPLCHDQTGVICDAIFMLSISVTITNGFDTRNSTISSRNVGKEL